MKSILRQAACAVALLAATAAQATTYNFSYTFTNGNAVTGSFDGTANGNLITGLNNISVVINGVDFSSGPSGTTIYNFASDNWGGAANAAVASFDGSANNLLFSTTSRQPGGGFFYGQTFSLGPTMAYLQSTAVISDSPFTYSVSETTSAAHWSISAVPEPATYGMLLGGLGLGLVGWAARRRRAG